MTIPPAWMIDKIKREEEERQRREEAERQLELPFPTPPDDWSEYPEKEEDLV